LYDAIVVGARCAGSPTAMLLARKGHRVLLVDRATFPSDVVSTHFITVDGVARLAQWGLLDRVRATGCPDLPPAARFLVRGEALSTPAPPIGLPSLCPRRTVLDQALMEAAREAGAEVRLGFSVRDVLKDDTAVVGIEGQGKDGVEVTEMARIVVGADGRESFIARTVGAEKYNVRKGATCGYYSYFSGIDCHAAEVYIQDSKAAFLFPTNDGRTCVVNEWPIAEFKTLRADIEGNVMRTFDAVGQGQRVRAGKREERWYGKQLGDSFYRKPFGPGWALVGDAGFYKDPILGQGINDAFRDAEALANAIDAGLTGQRPMEEALAAYEKTRNNETAPIYEITAAFATLDPPPVFVDMIRMAAQQAAAAR
jgi:2-polyprenyl-6-methoxyphenol hydroxylase-like FAD-dependent oxidoreductase